MYSKGYRPMIRGKHHFIVQQFVEAEFSSDFESDILLAFGDARQTRNTLQYDTAGIISNSEVTALIAKAEIFVTKAKTILEIH